jgi:hypothetical protein
VLGPLPDETAKQLAGGQGGTRLSDLEASIPKFKKLTYDAFKVEYDYSSGDVIVHFYLPARKVTEHYWKVQFAEVLNEEGQEHFQATKPRLVARYTEELHSWWFKAQSYGHIIDLEAFVTRFFEKLAERMALVLPAQSQGA